MALNQALSGINAAQADLNVISNNVANAGTTGFKGSTAEFSDVFAYQRATLDYGIRSHEHARDWFAALADRVQPGRAVRG